MVRDRDTGSTAGLNIMEKLIVLLIVVVISLIQSAIKKAAENREAASRPLQRPQMSQQPRPRQNRSDIEDFLSNTQKPAPAPPGTSTSGSSRSPQRPRNLEQASERSRGDSNRPTRPDRAAQQKARGGTPRRASSETPRRAARDSGSEKIQHERGGAGVSQHVDEYLARRAQAPRTSIEEHVRADMAGSIRSETSVNKPAENSPMTTELPATARSITAALRSPEGIRQAILVNEILQRPRIFRR